MPADWSSSNHANLNAYVCQAWNDCMRLPIRWTLDQLRADASEARRIFRHERLDEPLERYLKFFEIFADLFRATIDRQLGRTKVPPCAVLSGVFAPPNLVKVQDDIGVVLFWQHRFSDLADFPS